MRSKNKRRSKVQRPNEVILLSDGVEESEVKKIKYTTSHLLKEFGLDIKIEDLGDIWRSTDLDLITRASRKLVSIRVTRWDKEIIHDFVSPSELNFEIRKAQGKIRSFGVVYDGFLLASVFFEVLMNNKLKDTFKDIGNRIPVIITDRQIATFGEDGRYHLRICVLGSPTIISLNGFFSAPAKPIDYHLTKMISEDKALIKGEELRDYINRNVSILARAYIVETIIWNTLGIPFCSNRTCFLSDSHTIEELIESKKKRVKLCAMHKEALGILRDKT